MDVFLPTLIATLGISGVVVAASYMDPSLNYGIAGAVLAITFGFLRFLKTERAECAKCRREHNAVITNHLAHALEVEERGAAASLAVAQALAILNERLKEASK